MRVLDGEGGGGGGGGGRGGGGGGGGGPREVLKIGVGVRKMLEGNLLLGKRGECLVRKGVGTLRKRVSGDAGAT